MANKSKKEKVQEEVDREQGTGNSPEETVGSQQSTIDSPEEAGNREQGTGNSPEGTPEQPEPVEGAEAQPEAEHPEPVEGRSGEEPVEEPDFSDEQMPVPDVYQTLQFVAGLLAEQAWQFMGLRLSPGRKEPVRDMAQAKIAIDTIIFVADRLHPRLDEQSRRELRGLISDLQLNFVQQG